MNIAFVKGPIDRETRTIEYEKYVEGGDIFVLDPSFSHRVRNDPNSVKADDEVVPQHRYRLVNTPEGVVAVYQGEVK
jgi:plasmid replication initiation protein